MGVLSEKEVQNLALHLDTAMRHRREVLKLTAEFAAAAALSIEDAYRIQAEGIRLRLEREEQIVGYKMGLTSKAKMKQMGVHAPIFGVLTDAMQLKSGSPLRASEGIHAKIEPEIAFILGAELSGSVTPEQAFLTCSGATAGVELIDSRYKDFDFTLADVIADNCSSWRFAIGKTITPVAELEFDHLGNLGMLLEVNGEARTFASSSAILDHPAASLAQLSEMLGTRGLKLAPGMIVLAGAATQAIALEPGTEMRAAVQSLGTAAVQVLIQA